MGQEGMTSCLLRVGVVTRPRKIGFVAAQLALEEDYTAVDSLCNSCIQVNQHGQQLFMQVNDLKLNNNLHYGHIETSKT